MPLGLVGLLGAVAYADVPEASLLRDRVSPCFNNSPVGRPFTQPLVIPPAAAGVRTPTTDVYEVVEQRTETEIVPGVETPVWGYNGMVPGPTFLAEKGRPVEVTFTNDLPPGDDPTSIILQQPPSEDHHFEPSSTTVHLHGINADHLADGTPGPGLTDRGCCAPADALPPCSSALIQPGWDPSPGVPHVSLVGPHGPGRMEAWWRTRRTLLLRARMLSLLTVPAFSRLRSAVPSRLRGAGSSTGTTRPARR